MVEKLEALVVESDNDPPRDVTETVPGEMLTGDKDAETGRLIEENPDPEKGRLGDADMETNGGEPVVVKLDNTVDVIVEVSTDVLVKEIEGSDSVSEDEMSGPIEDVDSPDSAIDGGESVPVGYVVDESGRESLELVDEPVDNDNVSEVNLKPASGKLAGRLAGIPERLVIDPGVAERLALDVVGAVGVLYTGASEVVTLYDGPIFSPSDEGQANSAARVAVGSDDEVVRLASSEDKVDSPVEVPIVLVEGDVEAGVAPLVLSDDGLAGPVRKSELAGLDTRVVERALVEAE
ncbi:hypothetical protein LTR62_008454 [Meristemomyces frigidus]|uniref:Uncharacterized protein n=1 Tax=Meristemomyces frigidus TaxID=1508187 RepID=A0AAN7TUI5_9PEZI|nr:hypothetical protein LTR62_008454 [Meristemomyces frigidus]